MLDKRAQRKKERADESGENVAAATVSKPSKRERPQDDSGSAPRERKRKKEMATRVVDESTQRQLDSVLGSIF